MEVICPFCNTKYKIKVPEIPPGKRAVARCKRCGEKFSLIPESEQKTVRIHRETIKEVFPSKPEPVPPAPGISDSEQRDFHFITEEETFNGYAGFWKRFAASLIDGFALMIAGGIVGGLFGFLYGLLTGSPHGAQVYGRILGAIIGWLYFALLESSPKQATLGKMALGIKVTDTSGKAVSFWRATARHFAKIISACTFAIGYLAVAFTKKKQGFHDMIAGCLVVNSR